MSTLGERVDQSVGYLPAYDILPLEEQDMSVQAISKEDYAVELAQAHFRIEPGMMKIMRLESLSEDLKTEPLKLLEVNEDTVPVGLLPIRFQARVVKERWYPPIVIYEITPEEYEEVKNGQLQLPTDHQIKKIFERKDFGE